MVGLVERQIAQVILMLGILQHFLQLPQMVAEGVGVKAFRNPVVMVARVAVVVTVPQGKGILHQLHQMVAMALLPIRNKEETVVAQPLALRIMVQQVEAARMRQMERVGMGLQPQVVMAVLEHHQQLAVLRQLIREVAAVELITAEQEGLAVPVAVAVAGQQ
jgi:hypothetical protein